MKKHITISCLVLFSVFNINTAKGQQGFIGEIRMFSGNFPPSGWAFCDGQLLPISSNTALFSILGATYGGDGSTTFALPDMRGRLVIGEGQGGGLSPRLLGQRFGTETNTLNTAQLPEHGHSISPQLNVNTSLGEESSASGVLASHNNGFALTADASLGGITVSSTGNNQPINNLQPFLTVHYIICLQGTLPLRN
tara:strand:+ start:12452 stop:13036 length:585 start_codon:yes stop_codon:yes gene_type:complete